MRLAQVVNISTALDRVRILYTCNKEATLERSLKLPIRDAEQNHLRLYQGHNIAQFQMVVGIKCVYPLQYKMLTIP